MVINLKGLDKKKHLNIASALKKTGSNIEISRPVFLSPDGKEVVIAIRFSHNEAAVLTNNFCFNINIKALNLVQY